MLKQLVMSAALLTAASTVAVAGNGTNLTKYVADSTQVFLVFDVAGAKNTKLLKESVEKILDSKADARAKLAEIGMDPLRDIATLALSLGGLDSISNAGESQSMVLIVEGKFPKAALDKLKQSTKSTYAGVDVYSADDSELAIVDGRMFVAKKGKLASTIDLVKGKSKASLATGASGQAMRDVIKNANSKSHVWGTVLMPAKDRQMAAASQIPVDGISFGFQLSSDVEGGLRLEAASPAVAGTMLTTLNGALPQVKMMMGTVGLDVAAGTLALASDKSAVTAKIKLTNAELKALTQRLAGAKSSSAPAQTPPPPPPPGGLGKKTN